MPKLTLTEARVKALRPPGAAIGPQALLRPMPAPGRARLENRRRCRDDGCPRGAVPRRSRPGRPSRSPGPGRPTGNRPWPHDLRPLAARQLPTTTPPASRRRRVPGPPPPETEPGECAASVADETVAGGNGRGGDNPRFGMKTTGLSLSVGSHGPHLVPFGEPSGPAPDAAIDNRSIRLSTVRAMPAMTPAENAG